MLAILDAFPHDLVDEELTPVLWSLAGEGGWARHGGRAVLAASTYPNHATFVTGALPAEHGILTNKVWMDGQLLPAGGSGAARVDETEQRVPLAQVVEQLPPVAVQVHHHAVGGVLDGGKLVRAR